MPIEGTAESARAQLPALSSEDLRHLAECSRTSLWAHHANKGGEEAPVDAEWTESKLQDLPQRGEVRGHTAEPEAEARQAGRRVAQHPSGGCGGVVKESDIPSPIAIDQASTARCDERPRLLRIESQCCGNRGDVTRALKESSEDDPGSVGQQIQFARAGRRS